MAYNSDTPCVVIDTGSSTTRAGYAGDHGPKFMFPTVVGEPQSPGLGGEFIGKDAQRNRVLLSLKYPVNQGFVTDLDNYEKILSYTLDKLNVNRGENGLLLTETDLNSADDREKILQIMFEKFDMPFYYTDRQSVLALHNYNRKSGLVLDSGCSTTNIVPVFDGRVIVDAVVNVPIAGRDLSEYLYSSLATNIEKEVVDDIKHKLCYVSNDYEAQLKSVNAPYNSASYDLPNGTKITLTSERFKGPEALFNPSLIGMRCEGLHLAMKKSLFKVNDQVRHHMLGNIMLAGGNTNLNGLADRLKKELREILPNGIIFDFVSTSENHLSAWRGGSKLASDESFQELWISSMEYQEFGPSVFKRKCF